MDDSDNRECVSRRKTFLLGERPKLFRRQLSCTPLTIARGKCYAKKKQTQSERAKKYECSNRGSKHAMLVRSLACTQSTVVDTTLLCPMPKKDTRGVEASIYLGKSIRRWKNGESVCQLVYPDIPIEFSSILEKRLRIYTRSLDFFETMIFLWSGVAGECLHFYYFIVQLLPWKWKTNMRDEYRYFFLNRDRNGVFINYNFFCKKLFGKL